MTEFVGKHVPRKVSRLDRLVWALMGRPCEWAVVEREVPLLQFLPWWGPLSRDPRFEVTFRPSNPDVRLGSQDVFARYLVVDEYAEHLKAWALIVATERQKARASVDQLLADFETRVTAELAGEAR